MNSRIQLTANLSLTISITVFVVIAADSTVHAARQGARLELKVTGKLQSFPDSTAEFISDCSDYTYTSCRSTIVSDKKLETQLVFRKTWIDYNDWLTDRPWGFMDCFGLGTNPVDVGLGIHRGVLVAQYDPDTSDIIEVFHNLPETFGQDGLTPKTHTFHMFGTITSGSWPAVAGFGGSGMLEITLTAWEITVSGKDKRGNPCVGQDRFPLMEPVVVTITRNDAVHTSSDCDCSGDYPDINADAIYDDFCDDPDCPSVGHPCIKARLMPEAD